MEYKPSKVVAVVVVLVCIVSMLVIYKLTVGSKVSMPATDESPEALGKAAPAGAGGAGASHAVEVGDREPVTKPAEEKQPLPPGTNGKGGG